MSSLLHIHRQLLERWRHSMNLVGPGALEPHYQDAQEALAALRPWGHWADLGSGAGFPGIVLAANFPEVAVDLVERRRKRCTFLEAVLAQAARELPPRPTALRVLCKDIDALPEASYDGVTARALAPPHQVLLHAQRLLRPGGQVVLFLQGDAQVPEHPAFTLVTQRRYMHPQGPRRSVVLGRR